MSTPLPIEAFIWHRSFDGSWWLGTIKQTSDVPGRDVTRFPGYPGLVVIDLSLSSVHCAYKHTATPYCFKAFFIANRPASTLALSRSTTKAGLIFPPKAIYKRPRLIFLRRRQL